MARVVSSRRYFFFTVYFVTSNGGAGPSIFYHLLRLILRLCLVRYLWSRWWLPVVIQELRRREICHYPANVGILLWLTMLIFVFLPMVARRWWEFIVFPADDVGVVRCSVGNSVACWRPYRYPQPDNQTHHFLMAAVGNVFCPFIPFFYASFYRVLA